MYNQYHSLAKHIQALDLGDYLEFGCGDGGFLKYVLDQNASFKSVTALDINLESIKTARATLEEFNVDFVVEENLPLDFGSNQFDTITLSNTLHHLRDKPGVLTELKRIIKENGQIIITEMISNDLTDAEKSYCRFHALRAKLDRLHGVFHETTYTALEIQEMVSAAGLRIDSKETLLNSKEAASDKIEMDEVETKIDDMMRTESDRPGFLALDETARSIKLHMRQHGIKRPRQLFLKTTTQ